MLNSPRNQLTVHVMVTRLSIRLALRKLAEVTCGTAPSLIGVTACVEDRGRICAAIPWEYRDEVCSFLRQQLGYEIPVKGSMLVLTEQQASAVVALAMNTCETAGADTEVQECQ